MTRWTASRCAKPTRREDSPSPDSARGEASVGRVSLDGASRLGLADHRGSGFGDRDRGRPPDRLSAAQDRSSWSRVRRCETTKHAVARPATRGTGTSPGRPRIGHADRSPGSPAQDRRTPAADQRRPWGDESCRAPADTPVASSRVRPVSGATPGGPPRLDWLGTGEWQRGAQLGRPHQAGCLVCGPLVARPRPADPAADGQRGFARRTYWHRGAYGSTRT